MPQQVENIKVFGFADCVLSTLVTKPSLVPTVPPTVPSLKMASPASAFSSQQKLRFLARLRNLCWPSWMQPQQLSMCPGMFDLANDIVYGGSILMGPHLKLKDFPAGEAFHLWNYLLNAGGLKNSASRSHMTLSCWTYITIWYQHPILLPQLRA
jgi:hypothetical protein